MLTLDPARLPLDASYETPTRYRCESAAEGFSERRIPLGAHLAKTPRLAMRWLRGRARQVADQMDEPSAQQVLGWLGDAAEHERALAVLVRGQSYRFHADDDEGVRYVLTARPAVLAWVPRPNRPLGGDMP